MHGLWNAYAPSVLDVGSETRMWFGGWVKESDVGSDLIYIATKKGYSWSEPDVSFRKPGFAVNDPSVVAHPEHDWLFMYYTALAEADQQGTASTHRNVVGFASSVDGGRTWTDHGIVIDQNNGFNQDGAWAPSVVLSPNRDEFWVYYHTNSPSNVVLRTRLDLNGWQKRGETQEVVFWHGGHRDEVQTGRVNVDVAWTPQGFVMLTNDFVLNDVALYRGGNGLDFDGGFDENPIIKGSSNQVLTPHFKYVSQSQFYVYFGFATPDNPCSQAWLRAGLTDVLCSASIHGWSMQELSR